ncbi:hypothetical protein ACQY0O_002153 [Thecaphora frezii]
MDHRSSPSSASASRNGTRYFDTYGPIDRSGTVKPSFNSSYSSHLPASLGLGPSSGQARSGFGGRPGVLSPERRIYPEGKLVNSGIPGSTRLSGGGHADTGSPSTLAPNTWHDASRVVRRSPIPGLPPGAQLMESIVPQSTARNFLVPIGSTGARQKLSIANASQRRKLTTSDEVRWPAEMTDDLVSGGLSQESAGGRSYQSRAPGIQAGPPGRFATLPRSRSEGLIQATSLADPASKSNGFGASKAHADVSGATERPDYGYVHRRLASSQSSSSINSTMSPGFSSGITSWSNGSRTEARRAGSSASFQTAHSTDDPVSAAASSKLSFERPPILPRGNSLSTKSLGSPGVAPRGDRAPTSTEIVQAARDRAHAMRTDGLEGSPNGHPVKDGSITPPAVAPRYFPSPASEDSRFGAHESSLARSASAVQAPQASGVAAPTSVTRTASSGARNSLMGMFSRREAPADDSAAFASTHSEPRALTSAELYKQSMLERDLKRSAAEELNEAAKERSGTSTLESWDCQTDQTERPISSFSASSVSIKAPTIDLDISESSFFDLVGEGASRGSDAASSHKERKSPSFADEDSRKDSNTEESDRSTGSFEGAYVHPALVSGDSPQIRQAVLPSGVDIGSSLCSSDGDRPSPIVPGLGPTTRLSDESKSGPAETAVANASNLDDLESPTLSAYTTPTISPSSPNRENALPHGQSHLSASLGEMRIDDLLATPKQSRPLATATGSRETPVIPARSKDRKSSLAPSPTRAQPATTATSPATDPSFAGLQGRCLDLVTSGPGETPLGARAGAAGALSARESGKASLDDDGSILTSAVNTVQWQSSMDASGALSPEMRQSRFSEASTDASDSRTPTRNEHRLSALDASDLAEDEDDLEDESSLDGQMLPTSAWAEVENALRKFRDRHPAASADRGNLLRTVLLPFLALEAETALVDAVGPGPFVKGKARRALFFDWIRSLLLELQHVQTSADRGAILESIACIIESRNFSTSVLSQDPDDEAKFSSVFGHILSYAIGELNKKGVYQNTLIFSGRLLAVAFFRVEGVATKLLRALPVNRFALERVAKEAGWQQKHPPDMDKFRAKFPESLRQLCFKDARSYLKMLDNESVSAGTDVGAEDDRFLVRQPEVEVEMTGNWLRRWQSDDSELFFSFCRSYHRQLACLFASTKQLESVTKYFFGGPGYAHLATCVHQKCLALVHRVILSVTTLSSQKNFNPAGETANVLLGSTAGKPRVLEAANRRCTAIVVDIVRAPSGGNMIFAPMLGLHIKCLVKRTSLYDVQGVFCLLDWLDGVLGHMDQADLAGEGLIDISFIITTIGLLLEDADHALALMRTIAFCYANFGVLTATKDNRTRFCEEILLKPKIFNKLFLSWSFTIRAYFLHLLVFRLARINDFPHPPDDPQGKTAVNIARLFNQHLEAIRSRHDQLSPLTDSSSDDDRSEEADDRSKRRTATSFVSTIKKTPSINSVEPAPTKSKAERLLGLAATESARKSEEKPQSKAKNWLRALRGSKSSKSSAAANGSDPSAVQGRSKMTPVDEVADGEDDASTSLSPTSLSNSPKFLDSDSLSDASTLDGGIGLFGMGPAKLAPFEFEISGKEDKGSDGQANRVAPMPVGHDAGIASDATFDLQNSMPQPPTPGSRSSMHSPRVSKAFSRRSSMLPGPASELMGLNDLELPPLPAIPKQIMPAYEESLHIYAVQSLREYEQTVQEHDEFFASLPKDQGVQVPRLPVNWPAMWSSTGE